GGGVDSRSSSFETGLVSLKLLLRFLLLSEPEQGLRQEIMHGGVQMVWVHGDTLFESRDGSVPLLQVRPGPPKLKVRRRLSWFNLLHVFKRLDGFFRLGQAEIGRTFDEISRGGIGFDF